MGDSPLMRVAPEFKKYVEELSKKKGVSGAKATIEITRILKTNKKSKKREWDDWGIISVK